MDGWRDRPPEPNEFGGIRLIRVPKSKTIEMLITSPTMVGRDTHFSHRRTIPCTGVTCGLCLDGGQPRWHGYISICSTRLTSQAVLELTDLAAQPIIQYQDRHGSLRGALLKATRTGNRENSPVMCAIEPHDVDLRQLPPGVHLRDFLAVIWRMPEQPANSNGKPHNGPNIRNIHDADPPGSTAQPENPDSHKEAAS